MRSLTMVLGVLVCVSCGDSAAEGGAGGSGAAGAGGSGAGAGGAGGGGASALAFTACPLRDTEPFLTPPTGPIAVEAYEGLSPIGEWLAYADQDPALSAAMAECATMAVPADWTEPEGDQIEVFVKRFPAAVQPATGQLWMLEGGPGFPSATMEHTAFLFASTNPTLDIYLPDHRGTGKSTFAQCIDASTCAETIPHLAGLTTTGAARDLAALIDATDTGADVFVYAVSYGTYWAQRYLQLRPEQPAAVVLDSLVPVVFDFAQFDRNFDDKAHEILAICAADTTCSAKLGGDPVGRAQQVIDAVDPPCELPKPPQEYFGALVGNDYFDRLLLPASIYRALRCDQGDRDWLLQVEAYQNWYESLFRVGFSDTLQSNILSSEMWQSDATVEELEAERETMLAFDASVRWAGIANEWPRYPRDEYYGKWPSSPAPTLVLQGGLDARTPYGDVASAQYSGPNQYYVELPQGAHSVVWPLFAPMSDLAAPGCGAQIMASFLSNPSERPDTSCIAQMAPIDFVSPPPEWLALVGIDELWEN